MYAIVEIKGKQYHAKENGILKVDRIESKEGDKLSFSTVLLLKKEDGGVEIGMPYVQGITVEAEVKESKKDKKVMIFKKKRRKGYKKQQGHRQEYTYIKVARIALGVSAPVDNVVLA